MTLLIIDNRDSFIFNIVQSFQALGASVHLMHASEVAIDQCRSINPQALVIGPGPGSPSQAVASKQLIDSFKGKIPILGICLGHQCMGEFFGGKVVRAKQPMHGKTSSISHDGRGVFQSMPVNFQATRYHSLVIERHTFPDCLEVSAETESGEIMGVRHRRWAIEGVQFHPESCMTQSGLTLLANFLNQSF